MVNIFIYRRRKESRANGLKELKAGNKTKALELFQQCVDVTPRMAHQLIQALRADNVDYVVAPYEADAQLAYLEKSGVVSAILTEDSDLLVFGCQRVILKLDAHGNAVEINAKDLGRVPMFKKGWTFERFRQACILSGCDYLPSLKGIGLKKAAAALADKGSALRVIDSWKKWGRAINAPPVRNGYEDDFKRAELTFLYQRVYDPDRKRLVTLNPMPPELQLEAEELDFLGPDMLPEVAELVATGEVNPYSKRSFSEPDESDDNDNSDGQNMPQVMATTVERKVAQIKRVATDTSLSERRTALKPPTMEHAKSFPIFTSATQKQVDLNKDSSGFAQPKPQPLAERQLNLQSRTQLEVFQKKVTTSSRSHFFKSLSSLKREATAVSTETDTRSQRVKLSQNPTEESSSSQETTDNDFGSRYPTIRKTSTSSSSSSLKLTLNTFKYSEALSPSALPLTPVATQESDENSSIPLKDYNSFDSTLSHQSSSTSSLNSLMIEKASQQLAACANIVSTEIAKKYSNTLQEQFGADPDLFSSNIYASPATSGKSIKLAKTGKKSLTKRRLTR
ncbi:Rad2 nuclease [Chytridiales sp. JEL 0842]|nr:Rad2 nuclease [Chytridiales sp. JEL 0842]